MKFTHSIATRKCRVDALKLSTMLHILQRYVVQGIRIWCLLSDLDGNSLAGLCVSQYLDNYGFIFYNFWTWQNLWDLKHRNKISNRKLLNRLLKTTSGKVWCDINELELWPPVKPRTFAILVNREACILTSTILESNIAINKVAASSSVCQLLGTKIKTLFGKCCIFLQVSFGRRKWYWNVCA